MSEIPKDNLYTRDHEWIRIEGGKAEIGITDHAQKALGDIVFAELPTIEDKIDAGDVTATVTLAIIQHNQAAIGPACQDRFVQLQLSNYSGHVVRPIFPVPIGRRF